MKKLLVFFVAVFMAAGVVGTAWAAPTSVELSTATSGVSTVYWPAVFSSATGGASAYVVTGSIYNKGAASETGTTLYSISDTRTNAAGTEMRAAALSSQSSSTYFLAGTTPIGGPALISGTSDTVIFYVFSNVGVGGSSVNGGNTLYAVNGGTGAVYWSKGIPANQYGIGAGPGAIGDIVQGGGTPYALAPVTIDAENTSYAGATIYGVSGAGSTGFTVAEAGVSVWGISAQTGTYSVALGGRSNVTGFPSGQSGVSVIHAAPVVSGASLFVVGYSSCGPGVTIFQFDKNNLVAGIKASGTVNLAGGGLSLNSFQFTPTPTVSGTSIFVVDTNGGVTSFYTANLTRNYPSVRYGNVAISGVSASPVTDGTRILLASATGVTCYKLNALSGNSKEWTYEFGVNKVVLTPALSNGYAYVTVNDTILNTATTYRFTLASVQSGDIQTIATVAKSASGAPFIVSGDVWTTSYDPIVQKATASGAAGYPYWTQFKFDKGKTGYNTYNPHGNVTYEDDSNCFISTLK